MNKKIPFRYDYVGSFLRPSAIKNARALYKANKLSKEELNVVENEEIAKLIQKQKNAGFHVITDGEFRRAYWHLDFFWGLNGIEETELSHGYFFHGEETAKGSKSKGIISPSKSFFNPFIVSLQRSFSSS